MLAAPQGALALRPAASSVEIFRSMPEILFSEDARAAKQIAQAIKRMYGSKALGKKKLPGGYADFFVNYIIARARNLGLDALEYCKKVQKEDFKD